jgi:hypothetical protein
MKVVPRIWLSSIDPVPVSIIAIAKRSATGNDDTGGYLSGGNHAAEERHGIERIDCSLLQNYMRLGGQKIEAGLAHRPEGTTVAIVNIGLAANHMLSNKGK